MRIYIHAFAAGRLHDGFEGRLAAAAKRALTERLGAGVDLHQHVRRPRSVHTMHAVAARAQRLHAR